MKRIVILAATLLGCTPVTISRIGPQVPARGADCEIEVLEPEQEPQRPYRDLGVVALENCQDYRSDPCREWLRAAACELGGHVAYPPTEGRPESGFGPVTFRIRVAGYISELRADPPRTGDGAPTAADCEDPPPPAADAGPGRCME